MGDLTSSKIESHPWRTMEAPLRHIHSRILPCLLAKKVAEIVEKLAQPIIQSQISMQLEL